MNISKREIASEELPRNRKNKNRLSIDWWNAKWHIYCRRDWAMKMKEWVDHYLKGTPAPEWIEKGVPYRGG